MAYPASRSWAAVCRDRQDVFRQDCRWRSPGYDRENTCHFGWLLLITLSIGLFAAAWKGRSVTEMNTNSVKGKLLVDAFCAAPSALVFGFCLVRTTKHFDSLSLTATVLFGACLIADLLYTRYEVRRLAASEIAASEMAKRAATQFCGLVFSSACFPSVWVWRCRAGIGLALISCRDLTCCSGVQ